MRREGDCGNAVAVVPWQSVRWKSTYWFGNGVTQSVLVGGTG